MSSFVSTDPASWTEENLEAQNVPTLKAVVENLGLVLDKDDQRRSRPGNPRFLKGDFKLVMLDHKIALGQAQAPAPAPS